MSDFRVLDRRSGVGSVDTGTEKASALRIFLNLSVICLTCSQSLLTCATKSKSDVYPYSPTSANLVVEIIKLVLSFVAHGMTRFHRGWSSKRALRIAPVRLMLFALPAGFYAAKNLLQYKLLLVTSAPNYQLLKNLNVLSTGVLYKLFLNRRLSRLDSLGLLLLMLGSSVSQLEASSTSNLRIPVGVCMIALAIAFLSGAAGVYTEIMLKRYPKSIHVQNIYMYFFGVVFNLWACWDEKQHRLLENFTPVVWFMVLNHALSGMAIAFLLKHANSVEKVKSTSLAMCLTTFISIIFFNFELSVQFALGTTIILVALYIPTLKEA